MIKQPLLLLAALFLLCSSLSSQEYSYDGDLTENDIDQSVLYFAPNDPSDVEEDKTYIDQIIDPGEYTATTGCLDILQNRRWGGETGGECANTGSTAEDVGTGMFTFGNTTTVISQTQDAIAQALKIADITVVGYRWQWRVKNADTNNEDTNGALGQDPLIVTVTVKDKSGNILDEREWDYSEHIDQWETKYGMHWYDPFITGDKIDTLTLEVEGKDAGEWPGWYGPEFGNAAIYSTFVYDPDPCKQVPVVDPTCEDFIGNAPEETIPQPQEDEWVYIQSTGEVASLEEQLELIEEVEEPEVVVSEDVKKKNDIDPLSVAEAAVSNSLSTLPDETGNISIESIIEQSINIEIVIDTFDVVTATNVIENTLTNVLSLERSVIAEQKQNQEESEEEAKEESLEVQEDLVAAAIAGDDSEDAQAALMGYNPNFAQYQQPQMADADFYAPKEIYEGQQNYDNPAARFFNGASDATHREMVRQQYEGN